MSEKKATSVFTIGHSTHTIDEFIALLKHYHITQVIDIRTVPGSRHNPQFGKEALANSLKHAGITYTHLKKLGGLRRAHRDSINTAWHNASFRGFADYMQTKEFKEGIDELIRRAQHNRVAIMCAEAVPWRCHRSLIGDALLAHHIKVEDIFSLTVCKPHTMTPWAEVNGQSVTYPAQNEYIKR